MKEAFSEKDQNKKQKTNKIIYNVIKNGIAPTITTKF